MYLDEEESNMKIPRFPIQFAALVLLMAVASLAAPCPAQDANTDNATSFAKTKEVLGLEGLKHNVTGTLAADNGSLAFTTGKKKVVVPAASITETLTGEDTRRTIGGTVGFLSMFAPYGSGRFLSLFRTKIDTLAIEYVDASGGIHGAIFTLKKGNALGAKKALLSQGAKTSVPVEAAAQAQATPKDKQQ
jgi:hypothetical protein